MRLFLLFLASILVVPSAVSGPFGTDMGMTKADLGIASSAEELAPYKYQIKNTPKNSRMFETYIVTVTPNHGLCYLKAVGVDINTSRYGSEVRTQFERVDSALKKKYASGERVDFLRGGSIWDEPEDFMMGLVKKERLLQTYYDDEEGSKMVEDVQAAYLSANGLAMDKGYLVLDYRFRNFDACQAEIRAIEDDVF